MKAIRVSVGFNEWSKVDDFLREFRHEDDTFTYQVDNVTFVAVCEDEDAMDIFVWSDFAFSRLFLESTRRPSDGGPTRPLRCAVRLFSIMLSILEGDHPDLDRIIMDTRYGIAGNREFMVNGKQSNRMMSCNRLVRPVLKTSEIRNLASEGFEGMIVPERRLDTCMYYAARSIRG